MKTAYFFFFLVTVSLGRCDNDCFMLYSACGDIMSNMEGASSCKKASDFMNCLVETTAICIPGLKDTVEKYKHLVDEGCQPGSQFLPNLAETLKCLFNDTNISYDCELEGEFDNLAEVCSSVSSFIHCTRLETDAACGKKSGNVYHKLLKPIQDLLSDCENSKDARDMELDECNKALLKCDRRVLTAFDYSCLKLERVSKCYLNVATKDCGFSQEADFMRIARGYVDQIPDFCDPASTFMQSFERSNTCIWTNHDSLLPCFQRYQEAFSRTYEDYDSNEFIIDIAKATAEYRDCCEGALRNACGEEAAFVASFVLDPLVAVADDSCLELTGEKCNGAMSLKFTILLLILTLKHILIKED